MDLEVIFFECILYYVFSAPPLLLEGLLFRREYHYPGVLFHVVFVRDNADVGLHKAGWSLRGPRRCIRLFLSFFLFVFLIKESLSGKNSGYRVMPRGRKFSRRIKNVIFCYWNKFFSTKNFKCLFIKSSNFFSHLVEFLDKQDGKY